MIYNIVYAFEEYGKRCRTKYYNMEERMEKSGLFILVIGFFFCFLFFWRGAGWVGNRIGAGKKKDYL